MSDYTLGDTIYHAFTTRAFATGVPTALAGSPTLEIYENDSVTPIVEGAGKLVLTQNLNSINGFNLATITATAGNGFETGKTYHTILKTGTVGGTSVVGEVVFRFTLGASAAAADLANGTDGLGAIKAETASILTDTAEIGAAGAGLTAINLPDQTMNITGNLSGSVGSVTGAVGSVTGAVGSVTGAVGSVTGLTASNLDATVSSRMATYTQPTGFLAATFPTTVASTTNITGGTITTTTNLTNLPAAAALEATLTTMKGATFAEATDSLEALRNRGDAAWVTATGFATTAEIADVPTVAEFNARTLPSADYTIVSDLGAVADQVWDETIAGHLGAGSTGAALNNASAPSAATVADAVWDELLAGHAIAGSAGAGLSAAGSAGDPWSTPIPGAYGAGTAGKILGDNIDIPISSTTGDTKIEI